MNPADAKDVSIFAPFVGSHFQIEIDKERVIAAELVAQLLVTIQLRDVIADALQPGLKSLFQAGRLRGGWIH